MKFLGPPASGSQAGTTSSRNRFGQYLRTRAVPVQPRTPKQTANRAIFTIGSSAWRGLTDPQRTAWNDYAAQITRNDSLGSGYSPTGAELYTGSVIAIQSGGQTDPPLSLPAYFMSITAMAYVDPSPGPEALTATLNTTGANNSLIVETSGPVSSGLTSAAAVRRWRSLPSGADNLFASLFSMGATTVDLLTAYKNLFPSPLTGQVIWFRFHELFNDGVGDAQIVNKTVQTFRFVVP